MIGVGSTAIGASALVGSGAFSVARVDRDISVNIVGDSNAYLGLGDTSEYAEYDGDGQLAIDFGDTGEGGQGLSENANYVFNDVFSIKNQGSNTIIVDLSETEDAIEWETNYPRAYWSGDELGSTAAVGGDGEFNDSRPVLDPGEEVFVQFEFVGRDAEDGGDEDDLPDVIGIYAESTSQDSNV